MKPRYLAQNRAGTILPVVAVSLVGLCAFASLSVDVGMIAVAKSQCQAAADAAALAGARTFDGSGQSQTDAATANAKAAARSDKVLNASLVDSEISVRHGAYHYDTTSQAFMSQFPPTSPDTYTLTEATVTHQARTTFASVVGITGFTVSAIATAAHRPRDVATVLDFSGSMNNESDLWNNEGYLGSVNNSPNNTDPIYPRFGAYSNTSSAQLVCTSSDARVGACNVTTAALGMPAMVGDYYQQNRGVTPTVPAFTAVTSYDSTWYYPTTNPGDKYLMKARNNPTTSATTTANIAVTVQDVTSATSTQISGKQDPVFSGYADNPSTPYHPYGYTQGPGYWGKTFFIWPPDPTTADDWRQKFFSTNNNTDLWDSSGNWLDPAGNYTINYAAILSWIKNTGPNPFPTQLRAGRVLYYDAIPSDVPSSAYDHTRANSQITDPSQRFWKEYIDYTLGVWRDPFGNIQHPGNPACSYGPDFTWGTIRISAPYGPYASGTQYRMHPQDNPERPRHRMWFGPMTMIQFLSDTKLLPGTAHDISLYPAKLGIEGALQDILDNHPNDLVSMMMFNRPQFANDPSGVGAFSKAQIGLGRNYSAMIDSLWFPPNSSINDVRPWDSNDAATPRAYGDYTSNTTTVHGFMLAYNQFSGNTSLRATGSGGWGRKGSQRVVVLETDGMANFNSSPAQAFMNLGTEQSYYRTLPGDTVNGGGYDQTALLKVVQAIANKPDGSPGNSPGFTSNPGYPGYSLGRKPVQIHTVAFGAIFESTASGSEQTNAVALLQQISQIGGTVFPSSASDTANGYKWCTGSLDQRKQKLRQAFNKIMDDGVSVSLIQ